MIRAMVRVYGLVQGVFFRSHTAREARRLGLTGWVRNMEDGSVEAIFEGEEYSVERMISWCRRGPPAARVEKIEVKRENADEREFVDFEIRC